MTNYRDIQIANCIKFKTVYKARVKPKKDERKHKKTAENKNLTVDVAIFYTFNCTIKNRTHRHSKCLKRIIPIKTKKYIIEPECSTRIAINDYRVVHNITKYCESKKYRTCLFETRFAPNRQSRINNINGNIEADITLNRVTRLNTLCRVTTLTEQKKNCMECYTRSPPLNKALFQCY